MFRRLMFAIRFRSTDTFFSPNLTDESRVMMYRNIAERVERIAPFLRYDPDPYLTISDGTLVWMQDVYTTSQPVSLLHDGRRRELHPQLDQGDDRRLPRQDHVPRRRSVGSDRADGREGSSRAC